MKNRNFQEKIISEVGKRLNIDIVKVQTPPQGMDSEVFFATDIKDDEYAIKYGKSVNGDVLAYKLLKENKVDIPVPNLLGNFTFGDKTVLILEKINFPLLESVAVGEMHRYIPSMIENLKKIHEIKSDRAGLLNESGKTKSWEEVMLSKFNNKDSILDWNEIAKRDGLDSKLILKSVENIIKKINETEFTKGPYSFLHTDFNQRNLFIDPGSNEITGIIDWGEAMFGDPIYDFARIRMFVWHFDLGNSAADGYDKLLSLTSEEKQLEELYWLSRVIEYLAYYSEELNEFNTGRIKLHQDFLKRYNW